jgi:hypothetical protein
MQTTFANSVKCKNKFSGTYFGQLCPHAHAHASAQPHQNWGSASSWPHELIKLFFVFVFWIKILYHDHNFYMYCALQKVIIGKGGMCARDKALQC